MKIGLQNYKIGSTLAYNNTLHGYPDQHHTSWFNDTTNTPQALPEPPDVCVCVCSSVCLGGKYI